MDIAIEDPVPVIKDVMVNGAKLKAMIDTWQNLSLSLTPAAVKQLGLSLAAEKTPPKVDTMASLQVGPLKQDRPQTALYSKGTGLDHGLGRYGAILGAGFLSQYVVTFDYVSQQVIIQDQ